jgi:3-deoxy-D-manno-octulosonic-acid transferase
MIALPYYLYRMWRRGGYRKGMKERLGMVGKVPQKAPGVKRIWIQAVSVGETLAILPMLRKLQQSGKYEVCLTMTTSTARSLVEDKYREFTIWHGTFPLDFYFCSRAMWNALQPDLVLLTETELWPEHLAQAKKHKVPVLLINARISDRSFRRFKNLNAIAKTLLGNIDAILAGTRQDLSRFETLGWGNYRRLCGNLKFDVAESPISNDLLDKLNGDLFAEKTIPHPKILLGASTWPGEETALIAAWKAAVKMGISDLLLVIVPRHAERRSDIKNEFKQSGVSFQFRTETPVRQTNCPVYIADTTGELRHWVELADIVFVGKSLPPNREGQTPIEAAAAGKPIIMGPGMSNFRDISNALLQCGAAVRVDNSQALTDAICNLLQNEQHCKTLGENARREFQRNAGATEKVIAEIEKWTA